MRQGLASPRGRYSIKRFRQAVENRSLVGLLWTHDRVGYGARIPTNLALPHPDDLPSAILCKMRGPAVALGVAAYLVGPELRVGSRPRRLAAVLGAAVPEAPVHEHGDVARREHEVGGASLRDPPMEPEPPAAAWTALRSSTSGAAFTLRRPARCAPRSALTQSCATAPTCVGGTQIRTAEKYGSEVPNRRGRVPCSALTCAYALAHGPHSGILQAGG